MLHLYLSPRGRSGQRPSSERREEVLAWLQQQGLIGRLREGGGFAPGLAAATLFDRDARRELLPAELSFTALHWRTPGSPSLIPRDPEEDPEVSCGACEDPLPRGSYRRLEEGLALLGEQALTLFCPSCQSERAFQELSFEPPVTLASFWIFLEEIGTSRLDPSWLRQLERRVGCSLEIFIDERAGGERAYAGAEGAPLDEEAIEEGLAASWGGGWAAPRGRALREARARSRKRGRRR